MRRDLERRDGRPNIPNAKEDKLIRPEKLGNAFPKQRKSISRIQSNPKPCIRITKHYGNMIQCTRSRKKQSKPI
ncbi:hypothetical protein VNO77_16965 [Canavalia gladiata]|uniref:Uncharacterized protein n=1 Tax=Canavalia gladiata TaxID=3824 RepID=A0AAN9QIA8_CANGL